jgi:hypothetical protein
MEQTSPVIKSDDFFLSSVSLVSHFSFPRSHASPLLSHLFLLLLLTGVRGYRVTPEFFFKIMLACRRVLAHFGRKNPVFDEPTKFPLVRLEVSPYFFHGAFASGFTWCRRLGYIGVTYPPNYPELLQDPACKGIVIMYTRRAACNISFHL